MKKVKHKENKKKRTSDTLKECDTKEVQHEGNMKSEKNKGNTKSVEYGKSPT